MVEGSPEKITIIVKGRMMVKVVGLGNRGGKQDAAGSNRKFNPRYNDGKRARCMICQSIMHFVKDCPHAEENQSRKDENDLSKINLFQSDTSIDEMNVLIGECLSCALLDSGCTQTVCGQSWLKCYKEGLSKEDLNLVSESDSCNTFRFGKGDTVASLKKVSIPAVLGDKDVSITTDVIEADIPLLLSKEAMKKAEAVLDFNNDDIKLFGVNQPLLFTSSGHYAIPLSKSRRILDESAKRSVKEEIVLLAGVTAKDVNTVEQKEAMVKKLHKQFCHCSAEKLKRLLKLSRMFKDDVLKMVDKVSSGCQVCKIYKKAPPRPIVRLPLSSDFNHTVAMDLITYGKNTWILHLIDTFSRYSAACVRKSKNKDVIADGILKVWISYFGQPKRFPSDNGGEFSNEVYDELCEQFNIVVSLTAAESPFSNGLCVRHNGVLKESIRKLIEDTHCSLPTALCWAVAAKNSLHGHNGYSPNQIVFGRNPNYPSVLNNKVPVLESKVSSKTISNNLTALHAARKEYIKAESSEKIQGALRHNIRASSSNKFVSGEDVYYKRNDSNKWHGPAVVIGQTYKQVLVNHRGHEVRVHCSLLLRVDNVTFERDESHPEYNESLSGQEKVNEETVFTADDAPSQLNNADAQNDVQDTSVENITHAETGGEDSVNLTETDTPRIENESVVDVNEGQGNAMAEVIEDRVSNARTVPILKTGTEIAYKLIGDDAWRKGVIHSRAGKAGGRNQACRNIKDNDTGNIQWYDFDKDVNDWHPVTETTEEVFLVSDDKKSINVAKQKELQNWVSNKVYTEIDDAGQKQLNTRWVITSKTLADGTAITKARLVVKGFEEEFIHGKPKDSPTCAVESFRICLAVMALNKWTCKSLDVKAAFLQGHAVNRDIYVRPPRGSYLVYMEVE